ncbi:DUF2817 domain-containing protein [bacterium]|nr:DUF2817 domain-containing protein [bacterium]
MHLPQSLRLNRGSYLGETIDITRVLAQIDHTASRHGWTRRPILEHPPTTISAFRRGHGNTQKRIYLSAGIHGDEPAGPLAVLELLAQNTWPSEIEFWLIPCLNPSGFAANTRANSAGRDLNRDYRQPTSPEVQAHIELLESLPDFDLTICLHEDWEAKGFYLYELDATDSSSAAEAIIEAVTTVCPIDPSTKIDGRRASDGIIRPEIDPATRAEWPEAFYLFQHKSRLSYTLEAPSDFALSVRVQALVAAVRALLDSAVRD